MKIFKVFFFIGLLSFLSSCDKCKDVNCGEGGSCDEKTGLCVCEPGYSGSSCETYDACEVLNCQNGGTCVDQLCNCPDGYYGEECETYDPCREKDCGEHGTCNDSDGNCDCIQGWSGEMCDVEWAQNFTGEWNGDWTKNSVTLPWKLTFSSATNDSILQVEDMITMKYNVVLRGENEIILKKQTSKHPIFGTDYELEGAGNISGNTLTLEYSEYDGVSTSIVEIVVSK